VGNDCTDYYICNLLFHNCCSFLSHPVAYCNTKNIEETKDMEMASEEEGYIEIDVEMELTDEPIYAIPFEF
jgi:hypothetical protein